LDKKEKKKEKKTDLAKVSARNPNDDIISFFW
jgi:hypothetical protein